MLHGYSYYIYHIHTRSIYLKYSIKILGTGNNILKYNFCYANLCDIIKSFRTKNKYILVVIKRILKNYRVAKPKFFIFWKKYFIILL